MSTVTNLSPSKLLISQTDISVQLAVNGQLFSQTAQYFVSSGHQKVLIYLPFGISGGPLYFDYLIFRSQNNGAFEYTTNYDNTTHQGSSGHHYLSSGGSQFVVVADSGKEWTGAAGENLWRNLGYDYLREPPQDYDQFPLGYLIKISPLDASPYVSQTVLTDFRAYNHSVASGDFNGDGLTDYVVSGQATEAVDSLYWSRIGYLVLGDATGVGDPIWVTSPNLEGAGTKKFGMASVASVDLTGDGRDDIIFSGGASNALTSDKVVVVYQYQNGQLSEYSSVNGYGKFLSNPGYNHYLIDFDQDGDQDLLAYFGVGRVGFELLENTGSGQFKSIAGNLGLDQLSLLDFKHIQIIDFNKDGYLDIILDNLTPEWNLSSSPSNLSQAFIQNNAGKSFTFAESVTQVSGVTLGSAYQSVVTNFVGEVSSGTFQFVTSYQNSDSTEFGVFTQNISFTSSLNQAPVAKLIAKTATATEGKALTWSLPKGTFTDGDKGDVLTYSSDNLPAWLSMNSSTGKISGTFGYTAADSAPYVINITATDASGASASTSLTLTVKNTATIRGTANNDTITAGSGVDTITGLGGHDVINGGIDNDIINGGLGNDVLTGGSGADRFVFDGKLNALTNFDQITDFVSGTDQLGLKSSIFAKLKGDTNLSDNLWMYGVGTQDTNDYLIFHTSNNKVYYDADGSGGQFSAVEWVELVGVNTLVYGDFLVI